MNPKDKASLDLIRGLTRPLLLIFLNVTSFLFLFCGDLGTLQSVYFDLWFKLTLAADAEWILERPIVKIGNKLTGGSK